jgi:hypothetical protein
MRAGSQFTRSTAPAAVDVLPLLRKSGASDGQTLGQRSRKPAGNPGFRPSILVTSHQDEKRDGFLTRELKQSIISSNRTLRRVFSYWDCKELIYHTGIFIL